MGAKIKVMEELKYLSTVKDMPLLFPETRRTAILLCDGRNNAEISMLSHEKNVY